MVSSATGGHGMSMLRRQDDHQRDFRTPRRPRPRAAMDEGVMTTNRPSSLCIPAEDSDRRQPTRLRVSGRSHDPHHPRRRSHPLFKSRSAMRMPIASPSTCPFPCARRIGAATTDQAEPSNPHRLKTAISTPRVPSLEASGRRPQRSALLTGRAGIRNPSRYARRAHATPAAIVGVIPGEPR